MQNSKNKKRKLLVFAGGWGGEFLAEVLAGVIEEALVVNFDVFTFVNFSLTGDHPEINEVSTSFFKLPRIEDFDGVILLTNSFNRPEEIEYFTAELKRVNVPAVSIEYELGNLPTITTDNYSGMYSLCEHLIKIHSCKELLVVSGPASHAESITRVQAARDCALANGLALPDSNILEGNWGKDRVPELVNSWITKNEKLPDAIVCANDVMAMSVIDEVRRMGYDVPRDLLVTGYDGTLQARYFDPPISTVNHSWSKMGHEAFNTIVKLINKEEVPHNISLSTEFMAARTCGCDMRGSAFARVSNSRALTRTIMGPIEMDSHFRHFQSSVRNVNTGEDLYHSLSYLFEHAHIIEGNDFSLFLYPDFYTKELDEEYRDLRSILELDRVVCLENGKPQPRKNVDMQELILGASERNSEPKYYLFVPLHNTSITYGCAMLNGPLNAASENQYYIWSMHMMQALEQVESNVIIRKLYEKMERLSVTDPLTNIYNRAGCEKISYPYLIDWGTQGGKCIVMLIDVDKMKLINDKFGHVSGDIALKAISQALKNSLPEEFIISRFGGDEFFVAGTLKNSSFDIHSMLVKIEDQIKDIIQEQKIEFPLSASIGYDIIVPKTIADIEHGIDRADQDMYKIKKLHHEN